MVKKIALLVIILVHGIFINAQTVDEIKADLGYLWGEGTGITLKEADNEALQMLISQISVQVESKYLQFIQEDESLGDKKNYKYQEKVKSIVSTYSNATLHHTERIVINNEPDAKVFRYIRRIHYTILNEL